MKRIFTLLLVLLGLNSVGAQNLNPMAHPDAVVRSGKARFTVLTPEMIRIQYSDCALFEDRATFAIVNRRLPVPEFTAEEKMAIWRLKHQLLLLYIK